MFGRKKYVGTLATNAHLLFGSAPGAGSRRLYARKHNGAKGMKTDGGVLQAGTIRGVFLGVSDKLEVSGGILYGTRQTPYSRSTGPRERVAMNCLALPRLTFHSPISPVQEQRKFQEGHSRSKTGKKEYTYPRRPKSKKEGTKGPTRENKESTTEGQKSLLLHQPSNGKMPRYATEAELTRIVAEQKKRELAMVLVRARKGSEHESGRLPQDLFTGEPASHKKRRQRQGPRSHTPHLGTQKKKRGAGTGK